MVRSVYFEVLLKGFANWQWNLFAGDAISRFWIVYLHRFDDRLVWLGQRFLLRELAMLELLAFEAASHNLSKNSPRLIPYIWLIDRLRPNNNLLLIDSI